MANIFDDLLPPEQDGGGFDLFADLQPAKNVPAQAPLPPARPSEAEILEALGLNTPAAPAPAPAPTPDAGAFARLDPTAPLPPPHPDRLPGGFVATGQDAPMPPRRPDALPLEAPLPPVNTQFNPADTRGLSLELPVAPNGAPVKDITGQEYQPLAGTEKMRDTKGSQGNPTWLGDTNMSIEESVAEVNAGIQSAEKMVEETAERARQARERWQRVTKAYEGRPAPRPGSTVAMQIDTVKAQLDKEELAHSQAIEALDAARKKRAPALHPHADASRRGVQALATMLPDAAAGVGRILDWGFEEGLPKEFSFAKPAQKVSEFIAKNIHEDPARNEELIAGLGQGGGSAAGFILGGAGMRALGISQSVASTLLGGFQQAETKYREAEQLGKRGLDLAKNYAAGFATGGTEGVLGVGKILDDLERATGGGLTRYFGLILKEKGEEGFQEGVQTILENLQDRGLLGKDVKIEEGVGHAVLIGALIGGGMSATMAAPQLVADLMMPKPEKLDPETQAAILRELQIGPAPIVSQQGSTNVQTPGPSGAGGPPGAGGVQSQPTAEPEAAPAPLAADARSPAADPAGDPAGPEVDAGRNVGDPAPEPAGIAPVGSVPGDVGTETLDRNGEVATENPAVNLPNETVSNGQDPAKAPADTLKPTSQDEADLRLLLGDGWDLETAQDIMKSRAERAQAIREAQDRGVAPVEGPIPGYEPDAGSSEGNVSREAVAPQASQSEGGDPSSSKAAPSPSSQSQADFPPSQPRPVTGHGEEGTPTAQVSSPASRPVPANIAEVREGLPKDEAGNPDYTALGEAVAAVTGRDQPWGRLSQDEKQAVWDRLHGAAPVENQGNATGTSSALPVDSGEKPTVPTVPSVPGKAGTAGTATGPVTTPGTRITWNNVAEWTAGARTIENRPPSSKRWTERDDHLKAIADRLDLIRKETDLQALRNMHGELRGRRPPNAKGTAWEKVNQAVTDRIAQIEQGRADKPKKVREDRRQPSNLLELIAKNGGLEPSTELTMRDLHNHFLPGWGRLVRKGGLHLDKARELANEHGYMRDGTVDDLLNLIEDQAHRKIVAKTEREQLYEEEAEQDPAEREMEVADAIRDALDELGLGSQIDEEAMSLAVDLVLSGESDLVNAYERAVIQLEARDPEVAAEFEEADIPFDGASDEEVIGEEDSPSREDPQDESDEDEEAQSEVGATVAQEGQRAPADRGREDEEREDDGQRSGVGARSERDPGTRAGSVSEAAVLSEEIYDALRHIRNKDSKLVPGSVRKRLLDEGLAKGGSKLQLTDKGKQALSEEFSRRQEAQRDPIADDLIARGLMSSYQDTINLGIPPYINGKPGHNIKPTYPSRKFSFPLEYHRVPGGGHVTVADERMLDDPGVKAWLDKAGLEATVTPDTEQQAKYANWHHAVDMATDARWQQLAETQDHTTKQDIASAIEFHLGHKGDGFHGQISPENARKLAAAVGLEDPGFEQGIQDLFEHMDISKRTTDASGKKASGYFVNFHIRFGDKKDLDSANREAWALIHGLENGYLKHDRSGFIQPTQKLLDLKSGELDLDEAKKAGGKSAKRPGGPTPGVSAETQKGPTATEHAKSPHRDPKHPPKTDKDGRTAIGGNHDGYTLWEDENGVRSYVDGDGKRHTEKGERGDAFLTSTERPWPPTKLKGPRHIGVNHEGLPLWEDENGVRSIVEDGVRISEKVGVRPTGTVEVRVHKEPRFMNEAEYLGMVAEDEKTLSPDQWREKYGYGNPKAEFGIPSLEAIRKKVGPHGTFLMNGLTFRVGTRTGLRGRLSITAERIVKRPGQKDEIQAVNSADQSQHEAQSSFLDRAASWVRSTLIRDREDHLPAGSTSFTTQGGPKAEQKPRRELTGTAKALDDGKRDFDRGISVEIEKTDRTGGIQFWKASLFHNGEFITDKYSDIGGWDHWLDIDLGPYIDSLVLVQLDREIERKVGWPKGEGLKPKPAYDLSELQREASYAAMKSTGATYRSDVASDKALQGPYAKAYEEELRKRLAEARGFSTEKGADGKPQTVIPGAEQDQKGAAQAKAEGGLKAKVPQKDTDGLSLFNDSSKQGDLLDTISSAPSNEAAKINAPEEGEATDLYHRLKEQLIVFASGMSRIGDLKAGAVTVGGMETRGVGVEVNELSKPAIATLANAVVNLQTQVFIDSGAFGIFKRNLRNQAQARKEAEDLFTQAGQKPPAQWQVLSFDAILDTYDVIQEKIAEKYEDEGEPDYPRPLFVMPDIVGDQAGSLELVEKYAKRIQIEAEWNTSKPIVPIQKGDLSMAEAYARVVEILGTDNFIVGVPSNAKALSNMELMEFVRDAKPRGLHFLGAAAESRLDDKLMALAAAGVELEHLSADGNILRGSLYGNEPTGMDRPTAVSETLQTKSPESFEGMTLAEVLGGKVREGLIPNIVQARKIAKAMGEEDPKKVEEALEFGLVLEARRIVERGGDASFIFDRLVKLYGNQPTLGTRTSTSMLNQAYSTPLPLAFVASRLAGIGPDTVVYEPTAGNGALLMEVAPHNALANEINPDRAANLRSQGFTVTQEDGAENDYSPTAVDAVISNPPFGTVKDEIGEATVFDLTDIQKGYRTKEIDHAIALRALESMKDDGRAVLIIGSVNPQKERSAGYRGKAKNEFFLTLLKNYNVTDIFTVDGSLYKKQGAGWPVDVIVIEGRGVSSLDHPAKTPPPVLSSWQEIGGKLDGTEQPARNDTREGDRAPGDGAGRPDSGGGVRGGPRGGGLSSSESAGLEQSGAVSESSPVGDGARPATGGKRGGSRQPTGSRGETVDPLSALEAAIAAHYGEETPAPTAKLPTPGMLSTFRMNVNDAADFAFGRNGFAKALGSAEKYYTRAEQYYAEDLAQYGQPYADAVHEERLLLNKVARALGKEPPKFAKPKAPKPAKPAKAAAQDVAEGIKEAAEGLWQMFGGPDASKLSSGFTFDEDTYAKAKPHFMKAIAHLKDAAANIAQVADQLIGYMKNVMNAPVEMVRKMLPYLQRFISEVQAGTHIDSRTVEDQDLENAPEAFQGNPQQASDLDETANQVTYKPRSGIFGLGTLVPTNMRSATEMALEALEQKVGNLEQYVGGKLGYKSDEKGPYFIRNGQKERPFAAEQIDALALAIDNMERGAALIIGDQTGIGKGRVNAGILRYAMHRKAVPIFVTKDPGLYKDIYRDLTDIGIQEYLGREPKLLMTDAGKTVPLDEEERMVLKTPALSSHDRTLEKLAKKGKLEGYDALLTSYSQMQTVKGQETQRMRTLAALAPQAILALDESHNAGGTDIDAEAKFEAKHRAWEKKRDKAARQGKPFNIPEPVMLPDRAQFARQIIDAAQAAFYSSATYAKRPDVMDLYRKTDMRLAVENISELAGAISSGGVPMQQVVAAMLARAGQYVRRERSFKGVTYEPSVVDVDEDLYDNFSSALAQIQEFSKHVAAVTAGIDEGLKASGQMVGHDNATGRAGADSMNFTSIMHNLVGQMLLSINAKPAAEAAIAAVRRGEKPLIALANTNESFLASFAAEAGLKPGDAIDLDMSSMLARYLERTRWISVREPFMEEGEEAEKRRLTDEELGSDGVELFESVKAFLEETDFSGLPASPVDYIKGELAKAGIRVGEITGRTLTIDYTGDQPRLANRSGEERTTRGKNKTMGGFNGGEIDALILNQSGSTGFSMHASAKFKDQRKRVMVIAQAEANIDVHMQMLGRIHRTGQVKLPSYLQLIPNIPASKRPAAILLKKMASLNANTTANRSSALTAEGVVDFMNEYGDAVAAIVMRDDPELNERMDYPVDPEAKNYDGFMRKLTGRIPLLPVQEQKDLYQKIEETYEAYLAQLEAEGRNTLEAKTLELDAVPIRTIVAEQGNSSSPFTEPVMMTEYDVKKQGRPYQVAELIADVSEGVDQTLPADPVRALDQAAEWGNGLMLMWSQEARSGFIPFKERFLSRITDPEKREKHVRRLIAEEEHFTKLAGLVHPGARIRMKFSDDESVSGVVVKVVPPKEGASNPLALGQWKARVAVPNGARFYDLPFTRFVLEKDPERDEIAVEAAGWSEPVEATVKLFELAATADTRETRVIATGNLLKAYTTVAKNGSIINFRTRDGQVVPGIMLREKVKSLATAMEGKRVAMTVPEAAQQLRSEAFEQVKTDDGFLTVINTGRGYYEVHAHKARDKGGRYFLNAGILEATGKDFYLRGSVMRVDVNDNKLVPVLEAIMRAGGKITAAAELDESAITEHAGPPTQNQVRAVEGLYSTTLKAAQNAKIGKGSGQQWLATILNTPGVKPDEVAWIGLDTWLAGQKNVTKADVVTFIERNKVNIIEITKRDLTDAEVQEAARGIYEEELAQKTEDHLDRFGDNSEQWDFEAVPEEDEDSSGWEGTGFEDEMGDDLYELAGEERPTRWRFQLSSGGYVDEDWRTYDSEAEALKAGEAEADRRNQSAYNDLKTEIANNRMRPWHEYEKQAREELEPFTPRYSNYVMPDGENYREVLLTYGNAKNGVPYVSSHWSEPNILAHVRLNERTIDGERTLFIEEIQSDWHQEGRKHGYRDAAKREQLDALKAELDRRRDLSAEAYRTYTEQPIGTKTANELFDAYLAAEANYQKAKEDLEDAESELRGSTPDGPFKKDWHELALKRILRMAVEEGYDQVAWTSGHIQNSRYDLVTSIDRVVLSTSSGGIGVPPDGPFESGRLLAYDEQGNLSLERHIWDPSDLNEILGEENAKRLLEQPTEIGRSAGLGTRFRALDGLGIQHGGGGMTGFYDKILPAAADKLGKRFGARTWKQGGSILIDHWQDSRLYETATDFSDDRGRTIWTDAHTARNSEYKAEIPVHIFPITAPMKLAATVDGFPLFKLRTSEEGAAALEAARQDLIREIKDRVIGDHVGLEFGGIRDNSGSQAYADSLGGRQGEAEIVGQYHANRLISIGLTGDAESIYHESFHALQHLGAFTHQEVGLLERERERNRATVARAHGISLEAAQSYSDDEVDAYAAGLYGAAMDQNAPGKAVGIHVGLRRAFERLRRFVRRVINLLKGHGFQISEDVFERARSGELRQRLDRGGRGVGYGPAWDWQIAHEAAVATLAQYDEANAAILAAQAPAQNMARGTFSQSAVDEVSALNAANGVTPRAPRAAGAQGTAPSFQTPAETFLDRVRAHQQDSFRYLEKLQDVVTATRGAPLAEPADAYLAQIVYPGRRDERLHDFKRDHIDPLVKEIQNAKVSTDDIGLYLIAKHARERNALMAQRDPNRFGMDNGSGMADQTADDLINRFVADGTEPALERIAQRVYAILEFDKDMRHAAGLISDETRDHWDNLFPSGRYVPLRGFAERDEEHAGSHYGQGFDIRGREARQATGRESLSDNPLFAAIHMAEEGIIRAEKNIAGKSLLRLVKTAPNEEVWGVLRNPKRKYIDDRTGLVREINDNLAMNRPNVIGVKVGGVPYYIELRNENLALAYKNMGLPQFNSVTQGVARATRFYSSLQTGRNPEFFIPNFTRDVQEAAVTLAAQDKGLVKPFLKNILPALKAAALKAMGKSAGAQWDQIFEEWRQDGGKISVFGFRDMDAIKRDIEGELRRANWGPGKRYPYEAVRGVFRFVDAFNEVFENATRLASYKAAREKGMTRKRAAGLSRESTVNFTKRGRASAWMNAYFAFYNAAVQGNAKSVAMLARSKKVRAAWLGMMGLGFAMTMLSRFAFGDDDDDPEGKRPWDHVPEYEKRSNLILPYGTEKDALGNVRLKYVKIPLAFGFKIPFYLGQQVAEVLAGSKDPGKAAWDTLTNTLDAFNPLGNGQLLTMAFPTLLKPIPELLSNENWQGRNIYPESERWNEGLPRSGQATNSATPEWAVGITERINALTGGDKYNPGYVDIYPGVVDYTWGWLTGGLGRAIASSGQVIGNAWEGGSTPIERWPLARRFVGETTGSAEAGFYYDARKVANEHKNRFAAAKRAVAADPEDEAALRTLEREAEWLNVSPNPKKRTEWKGSTTRLIEDADEQIKALRQERHQTLSDKSRPFGERQKEARELEGAIQALQRSTRGEVKARTAPRPAAPAAPARTSEIQREEIGDGIERESLWDRLFGPSGPKTIPADTDRPYPTKEDLEQARSSGFAYGRDEAFLNGDRARIYGTVEKITVPPPKGARKGTKPTVLEQFRAQATPDGKLAPIMESLSDPRRTSVQPVTDPALRDDLGRAALAANRTALSTLGYRPRRTTLDTESKPSNLGGAYNPDTDEALILTQGNPSTPVHEALHRGIKQVREARPDLFTDWRPDEESIVRQLMRTQMGNPEEGKGNIADKQIARAKFWFEDALDAKFNRKRLEDIEAAAAEIIRADRPRGGPR